MKKKLAAAPFPAMGPGVSCTHTTMNSEYITTVDDWYGTESSEWVYTTVSTTEDIDIGRFRCTQCGEIFYYTGTWRRYFEEGIPCFGSDGVKR